MKISIRFFIFFLSVAFISCTKESDIFEEEIKEITNVETELILDYLNQEFIVSDQPSNCFEFRYPLTLNTNTNTKITIENNEGLKRLATSLNTDFMVTGIGFPVTINNEEISSTLVFKAQMDTCGIATFRKVIDESRGKCFDFQYPFTLKGVGNQNLSINNIEEYQQFLIQQGVDYEPLIQYPITVLANKEKVELNTNFDFYQIINLCEGECIDCEEEPCEDCEEEPCEMCEDENCNEFTIGVSFQDEQNINSVVGIIQVTQKPVESIQWFLDGELLIDETGFTYVNEFEEATTSQVCAKVKFVNCTAVKEVCQNITIPEKQNQVSICDQIAIQSEKIQEVEGIYIFSVVGLDFLNRFENSRYQWRVNDLMLTSFNSTFLEFKFLLVGQYEICVTLIDDECPNEPEACVIMNISEDELFDDPFLFSE